MGLGGLGTHRVLSETLAFWRARPDAPPTWLGRALWLELRVYGLH